MASYGAVKERQDVPIWNAIDAGNFKQALKLVDKRLLKKPTEYLQALKIFIRSQSPSISERAQVLLSLEVLPTRKSPITDLEVLELYDEALRSVLPEKQESWGKIIGELRFQGVKSSPKDEALSRKCLKACLSNGDLDHARQIAISLEKNLPNQHAYVFWNITLTSLYSKSPHCPAQQRDIFGKLAFAQIDKLAAATIEAGTASTLPTRSIHTAQELLLLQLVAAIDGKPEKQLQYLQNPYLGPESVIAKGDWSLWRDKLQLMTQARQWQDLFQVTGNLLKRARTKDASGQISESRYSDWVVWEAYLQSALEIYSHENYAQVVAEIQAHLVPDSGVDKSWRRNASIAWLKLSYQNPPSKSGADGENLQPILAYLEKYGKATTAYNDLRPFAERLHPEDRFQLVRVLTGNLVFGDAEKLKEGKAQSNRALCPSFEDFTTANNITAVINRYKLIYLVTSSLPEHERLHSPRYQPGENSFQCKGCNQPCGAYCRTCLETLALSAIQSYGKAIKDSAEIMKKLLQTDRHPADDLCVLSAMCLIKLSFIDNNSSIDSIGDIRASYILQATMLLEYAWSHSKPNFQISLLLIRLYSILGCGSLAMRAFEGLGIKQIQLDTLSYTLFDRISSLHPHPIRHNIQGTSQAHSPLENLDKQQRLYRKSRDHVSRNCWLSLENGTYSTVFQMKEFEETLNQSISAVMSVVESRKIARLTQPKGVLATSSGAHDIFNRKDSQAIFSDTNDYESSPNFEATTATPFVKLLQSGLGPSVCRTQMNIVAENLMLIIDPDSDVSSAAAELWLEHRFENTPDQKPASEGSRTNPTGLTKSEVISMQAHNSMASIILYIGHQKRLSKPESASGVKDLNEDLCDALETQLAHITKIKNEALAVESNLHALYMAYELGTMVLKFASYLSRTKQDVYNTQDEANLKTRGVAERLVQAAIEKSKSIKKELDESGWIDKVLESMSQGEQGSSDESKVFADALKGVLGESFMEEWAGHILESWRDSVVGFSDFKAPAKD